MHPAWTPKPLWHAVFNDMAQVLLLVSLMVDGYSSGGYSVHTVVPCGDLSSWLSMWNSDRPKLPDPIERNNA
jgi:hypothetical protein